MKPVYLGIDAGNSKTAVLACLASGEVIGVGRAGCGDIYGVAEEPQAVRAVLTAADDALAAAGVPRSRVASAAFRLAGVDWPEDAEYWDAALQREWPGLTRSILQDGYAAIRCGEPSGVGVAVNAGTAAAIAARGPDGTIWEMGWWGQHAMGAIGLVSEALKAVYLAELGAAPETALAGGLVDFYGVSCVAELNRWFTRRRNRASAAELPRAAPVVTRIARQGDPVASEIVTEQGRRLAFYAQLAARHAGLCQAVTAIPVVMAGSVLMANESVVATALEAHLRRIMPVADPRRAVMPPVAGAALDALAEAGVPLTGELVALLAETAPNDLSPEPGL
jgi:N-acetylglucosamine kinase-like BadF-type ATPase